MPNPDAPHLWNECSHMLCDVAYTFWSENRLQNCAVRLIAVAAGCRKVIRPVIMAAGRRSKRSKVKGHVGTAIQHSYLGRNQAAPWPRRCAPQSGFAWSGPHPHAGLLIESWSLVDTCVCVPLFLCLCARVCTCVCVRACVVFIIFLGRIKPSTSVLGQKTWVVNFMAQPAVLFGCLSLVFIVFMLNFLHVTWSFIYALFGSHIFF